MSNDLLNKIEDSIRQLKEKLTQETDGVEAISSCYISQLSQGQSVIKKASATTSIDERINLLVEGLNEVIDIAGTRAEKMKRLSEDLILQIETLEKQLPADSANSSEPEDPEDPVVIDNEDEKKN